MTQYLIVSPRDPIIVRDGRPFDIGNRMKPLAWPTPSLLAGSLRSVIGLRRNGGDIFSQDLVKAVLDLSIAGPLACADGKLWLPAPQDIVCFDDEAKGCMALRPTRMAEGEGCNLPPSRLLPMGVDKDGKASDCAPLWAMDTLADWLLNPTGEGFTVPKETEVFGDKFAPLPAHAARSHTAVDPDTLSVVDGNLFETVGLDFERLKETSDEGRRQCHDQPLEMLVRLDGGAGFAAELDGLDVLHPLGGERRLARWRVASGAEELWRCPPKLKGGLGKANQVRMVLATPALFAGGWRPGWLHDNNGYWEGSPPGSDVSLRLVGAALERWQPVSGWSVEQGKAGPKPMRRMVGAGAVYFFDVIPGHAGTLADNWLASVGDCPKDRKDGFGLALWGVSQHDRFKEGE